MLICLYPPRKGCPARNPKLQVMNWLLIESLTFDDILMQRDPIGIAAKGLIEVRERDILTMLIDPGGKQREIMQEFKSKTKRRKQNTHTGNQQKVFDKGIGFSYKTFHNIFFAEQGSILFLRGLRYIEMRDRANDSLFLCNALALLTYAQNKKSPLPFSGPRHSVRILLRT